MKVTDRTVLAAEIVTAMLMTSAATFLLSSGHGVWNLVAAILLALAAVLWLVTATFTAAAMRSRAWLDGWDEALNILAPGLTQRHSALAADPRERPGRWVK